MFLTFARVFPHGAREADLLALYTAAPEPSLHEAPDTRAASSAAVDHVHERADRHRRRTIRKAGATWPPCSTVFTPRASAMIRLDAVGLRDQEGRHQLLHDSGDVRRSSPNSRRRRTRSAWKCWSRCTATTRSRSTIARQVDWVYDFALPPLVLHALYARDATPLKRWLEIRPRNAVTVLDTHDGIGVLDVGRRPPPDRRRGCCRRQEIDALVETIHERSRGESRLASGSAASNVDAYQINCTFYDALGRRDDEYLIARAIQCFVPGHSADLLRRAARRRQRHGPAAPHRRRSRHQPPLLHGGGNASRQLARPVVQSLLALLRLRNTIRRSAGRSTWRRRRPTAGARVAQRRRRSPGSTST